MNWRKRKIGIPSLLLSWKPEERSRLRSSMELQWFSCPIESVANQLVYCDVLTKSIEQVDWISQWSGSYFFYSEEMIWF